MTPFTPPPNWFISTLAAFPSILWMLIGLGLPWALVILPRRDWRDWPAVACLSLAFGPALMTAWMFVLGTLGMNDLPLAAGDPNPMQTSLPQLVGGRTMLTPQNILLGSVVIALLGIGLAARKFTRTRRGESRLAPATDKTRPLAPDEVFLIALIVLAVVVRWITTSFLPFGEWDELWVYGYQGRIYTLLGFIPRDIGYYPQFLPLQYAYTQIMTGGLGEAAINDFTARAVIPFLQVGSILAAYLLGTKLVNRRAGLITAGLWALYPDFGYWTRVGDLEIPMAFTFTASAAFFLRAWVEAGQEKMDEPPTKLSPQTPLPKESASLQRGLRTRLSPFSLREKGGGGLRANNHRRSALIAGLLFGVAMWTKPTAGAFVWGVVLLLAVDLARSVAVQRSRTGLKNILVSWLPRFEVAALTGLACIPLGALWYIRNILLGHDALVFPPSIWLTRAMRSGVEFGWPLLALGVLVVALVVTWRQKHSEPPGHEGSRQWLKPTGYQKAKPTEGAKSNGVRWQPAPLVRLAVRQPDVSTSGSILYPLLPGLLLIALALAPTILQPRRIALLEWIALLTGVLLTAFALWQIARARLTDTGRCDAAVVGWALLLALPYFVTWFYSYSYHYRLSFAIVPLLILPTAVMLARWLPAQRILSWKAPLRVVYLVLIAALALPSILIANYDYGLGWNYLPKVRTAPWSALTGGSWTLWAWSVNNNTQPVVFAPGHQRLPFIYPTWDIRITGTPRTLDALSGVTHFVDSLEAREVYAASGESAPFQNQLWGSLHRENVATLLTHYYDSAFMYDTYALHPEQRFVEPVVEVRPSSDIIFGAGNSADAFARYVGHTVNTRLLRTDGDLELTLVWQGLDAAPQDYSLYVHLISAETGEFMDVAWDGPVAQWNIGYYSTLFWERGEYIIDRRVLRLPADRPIPPGAYQIRVGFYHIPDGIRAPVFADGAPAGDGLLLETTFNVED
ncbi:MAG: hypothetical protein SF029_12405 [bacterium]|nr:hypothetical protein [bacterium]